MTLGSFFDGIGGFPLAAQRCGIIPVWASEIEPAPINITRKHFPNMKHLGSVTDINGGEIEPVDIISFGSPCQDLSVAGKQKGLDGERSGLFLEAVRIIKEMRSKTNGVYPTYAIWENVPGAFSSHKGEDFRRVLEALAETGIPVSKSGKWAASGVVRTPDRELAWRTFDAQYWGVPQRRKRIYLVVDFRNRCAAEILFKCESLLGYSEKSGEERKETAATVGGCAESAGFIDRAAAEAGSIGYQEEMSPTLRAGLLPSVLTSAVFDARGNGDGRTVSTLTGDHERRITDYSSVICQPRDETKAADPTYCIVGNIVDRSDTAGANGIGVKEDCSYTLNTVDRHVVAYSFYPQMKAESQCWIEGVSNTLVNGTNPGFQNGVVYAIDRAAFNQGENAKYDFDVNDDGVASTLVSRGPSAVCHSIAQIFHWIVRRLTPRECERLQGFPDDWTRYGADGAEIKDAPRYKALGNSIAIPCAERVFRGIAAVERPEMCGGGTK